MDASEERLNLLNSALSTAYMIRACELKLIDFYSKGLYLGTVHTCIGQELIPSVLAKIQDKSMWFSNHRGHGHYLAKTNDIAGLFAEVLGREGAVSSGIGGSQHLVSEDFISNGIQGGLIPVGVGYSARDNLIAKDFHSTIFIGDGTVGQGVFYESLNLAKLLKTQTLIVQEDNGIAQSTPTQNVLVGTTKNKVESFEVKYFECDSNALDDLFDVCTKAYNYSRSEGPAFIRIKTQRLFPHSKGDDNRSAEELIRLKNNDYLTKISQNEEVIHIIEQADQIVEKISEEVLNRKQLNQLPVLDYSTGAKETSIEHSVSLQNENDKLITYLNKSLKLLFKTIPDLKLYGEDVEDLTPGTEKIYGGAFKATLGLSTEFPGRIRNTPISEQSIIGFGIGRALSGKPTIVEIMFADFIFLGMDQIVNNLSKIISMYGRKIKIPLVIRTATGGFRGYGPTHSSSPEGYFVNLPNILIFVLNKATNYISMVNFSFESGLSALVFENKNLYQTETVQLEKSGFIEENLNSNFGTLYFRPRLQKSTFTIIAFGYLYELSAKILSKLAMEEEIFGELISPSLVSQIDQDLFDLVVRNKHKAIFTIEESSGLGGIGQKWGNELKSELFDTKIINYGNDLIIPASQNLEVKVLPEFNKIYSEILRCLS